MRVVVQRVSRAEVRVDGVVVGRIGPGLLALVGVAHGDENADAEIVAAKLAHLRVMADDAGVMNRSVVDTGGAVLVVSQFTLHGDVRRGRRPSWGEAAPGEVAEPLVARVVDTLESLGLEVATGAFGAMMEVELVNDGPVTIVFEVRSGAVV